MVWRPAQRNQRRQQSCARIYGAARIDGVSADLHMPLIGSWTADEQTAPHISREFLLPVTR
jgi:hypothetical protein